MDPMRAPSGRRVTGRGPGRFVSAGIDRPLSQCRMRGSHCGLLYAGYVGFSAASGGSRPPQRRLSRSISNEQRGNFPIHRRPEGNRTITHHQNCIGRAPGSQMERREMLVEKDAATLTPATIRSATLAQAEHAEPNVAKRRGRPRSHAEHWTKVTVVLMDRQIVFLDRLIADIRAANRATIRRANLIRALIDSLAVSDL